MEPDMHSWAQLLKSCNTHHGKQLHVLFLKKGLLVSAVTVANRFLHMYSRCDNMASAQKLFDEMPQRNSFSWNTMIESHVKSGHLDKSLELFGSVPYRDNFSWNVVIMGFVKAGELDIARRLFDDMPCKDGVTRSSMIHGYARNGFPRESVKLFKEMNLSSSEMLCRDSFVLANVIGACTDLAALQYGKQVHAHMVIDGVEFDSVLASSLINLYGKCGDLDSASRVLSSMKELDDYSLSALIWGYANSGKMIEAKRFFYMRMAPCVVMWTTMISGYIYNNEELEALLLFNEMQRNGVGGDSSTLASVLGACNSHDLVKQLHSHALKVGLVAHIITASSLLDAYSKNKSLDSACRLFSQLEVYDTILLNSMITVYSNCGRIEDAKDIFKTMPNKSLISWNSMLVGLSQNARPVEALDLFSKMNQLNLRLDKFSLSTVISTCGNISSLELGEQVFARVIVIGLETVHIISSSLINLYCKCGFVEHGRKIFNEMLKLDEISWNSMLMGYAINGYGYEALALFKEMRNAAVRVSNITFTSVLSACVHGGLVDEGRKWFQAMKLDYHIEPGIEHYSCMVDLFSRNGCLQDAIDVIKQMPFEADASMWSSVLRACVANEDGNLGKQVAEQIIKLDPENSSAYVQLSNIFATSGDWERSAFVRKLMKEKQVKRIPGCSWATDC